jgi:uncharacterized membrane protein YccF (DUF307 family)
MLVNPMSEDEKITWLVCIATWLAIMTIYTAIMLFINEIPVYLINLN